MKKSAIRLATLAAAGLLYANAASAVPIAAGSELSINGSDTFTATSISFSVAAGVGGQSGSFSILPNCAVGCVTMTGTTFTASFAGQLYSVSDAGNSSTLSISPPSTFNFTPGALPSLTVTGSGTLTLTGFDPTPGVYEITTQGPTTALVTFSATSIGTQTGVPEPASMALLGSALFGFWWLRRRNQAS